MLRARLGRPPLRRAVSRRWIVACIALAPLSALAGPGDVEIQGGAVAIRQLEATGSLRVETGGERPRIAGKLDLPVVLLAPGAGLRASRGGPATLDVPLPWAWLAAVDLDLAARLGSGGLPGRVTLSDAHLDLHLAAAKLRADLTGKVFDGSARLHVGADARAEPPAVSLHLAISRAQIAAHVEGQAAQGRYDERSDLTARGRTLRELLAGLDGRFEVQTDGADLNGEPLGVLGRGLFELLLSRFERKQVEHVHCAVLRTDFADGIGRTGVVIDTGAVTLAGTGIVDLRHWRADIVLGPRARHPTIGVFNTPIRISGPLGALRVEPDARAIAEQTGTIVLFGVLSPWLLPVPFIDLGKAKGNPCATALESETMKELEPEGPLERVLRAPLEAGERVRGWIEPRRGKGSGRPDAGAVPSESKEGAGTQGGGETR